MFALSTVSLIVLFAAATVDAASCNADNCARAVTGTRLGSAGYSSQSSDCASFFRYTTTPPVSTLTTTVTPSAIVNTVTQTSITTVPYQAPAKQQNSAGSGVQSPSNVPSYASACSGIVRYSSACSCISGIFKTTITAATPVTTITVSATAQTSLTTVVTTSTTTSQAPASCSTFIIQVHNDLSTYNNNYIVNDDPARNLAVSYFRQDINEATTFTLDSMGRLANTRYFSDPTFLGGYSYDSDTNDQGPVAGGFVRDSNGEAGFIICSRAGNALTCNNNAASASAGSFLGECSYKNGGTGPKSLRSIPNNQQSMSCLALTFTIVPRC